MFIRCVVSDNAKILILKQITTQDIENKLSDSCV